MKGERIPTSRSIYDMSDSELSDSENEYENTEKYNILQHLVVSKVKYFCHIVCFLLSKLNLDNCEQLNVETQLAEVDTLNLDVTTMMAYVSNLTNGYCNFVFKQPLLSQQATWEAKRPVKPELDRLFEGNLLTNLV